MAGGQVTDLDDLIGGHAVVNERPESPLRSRPEHAQRRILRVGESGCDGHDPGQHAVKAQVGGHRDDRIEQQAEPGLLVEHPVHPVEHLSQELVELDVVQPSGGPFGGPALL